MNNSNNNSTDFTPKRSIVIPVDGSPSSMYAMKWGMEHLFRPDDLIILLTVQHSTMVAVSPFGSPMLYDQYEHLDRLQSASANRILKEHQDILAKHDYHVQTQHLVGDIREELLVAIEKLKPDLVVLGNRGLGKIQKALLGSVSDYLVHHVHVPIMLVHQ